MNQIIAKKLCTVLCVLMLWCGLGRAVAAQDPVSLLQGVTEQARAALKAHIASYRSNPSELYKMVETIIIPHGDFEEMARWVAGRDAWRSADEATRKAFAMELKKLVIRTYARSLLNYSNQTVKFTPLQQSIEGKTRVQVSSVITGGPQGTVHMGYRLIRSGETWKVYDVIIEGISLMQGFRSQFQDAISRGGIKAALEQIKSRRTS